jgi:ABC-type transport system substrate-binding protein
VFHLRDDVTFHDGSRFDANAVTWNFDKLLRPTEPQFDSAQAAQAATWSNVLANYRAGAIARPCRGFVDVVFCGARP